MPVQFLAEVKGADSIRTDLLKLRGLLPAAQVMALNRTGEDVLAGLRTQIAKSFRVRAPRFILPPNALPREMRATERNLSVRLSLGEGGTKDIGERRRKILEPFEDGRPKNASRIGPVAVPTTYLRPNRNNLIDPKLYPRFLLGIYNNAGELTGIGSKARIATRTQRRLGTKKGQQVGRYFVLGGASDKYWGLYERQTADRLRKLWNFRQSVPRPSVLNFFVSATAVFEARWAANFTGAVDFQLARLRW